MLYQTSRSALATIERVAKLPYKSCQVSRVILDASKRVRASTSEPKSDVAIFTQARLLGYYLFRMNCVVRAQDRGMSHLTVSF
jgi:hypothetical protein